MKKSNSNWLAISHEPLAKTNQDKFDVTRILTCVLFIFFTSACSRERAITLRGPKLAPLPQCAVDLGHGCVGEVLKSRFEIQNIGDEPLTFSLTGNCSCTEFSPPSGMVPPGEIVPVTVGVRLRYQGKDELILVKVNTNDPHATHQDYHLTGRCRAPFYVRPTSVDFGPIPQGIPSEKEIDLLDEKASAFAGSRALSFTTSDPRIQVITTDSARIILRLGSEIPAGQFGAIVTISTAENESLSLSPQRFNLRLWSRQRQ